MPPVVFRNAHQPEKRPAQVSGQQPQSKPGGKVRRERRADRPYRCCSLVHAYSSLRVAVFPITFLQRPCRTCAAARPFAR